jgi:hypothetical protein
MSTEIRTAVIMNQRMRATDDLKQSNFSVRASMFASSLKGESKTFLTCTNSKSSLSLLLV